MKNPTGPVTIRHGAARSSYASIEAALPEIARNFWQIGTCESIRLLRSYDHPYPWTDPCWSFRDGVHCRHERDGNYTKYRGAVLVQDQHGLTIPRWKLREILLQDGSYKVEWVGAFELAREKRQYWSRGYCWSKKRRARRHKSAPKIFQFYRRMRADDVDEEFREYRIRQRIRPVHLPLYFWFNEDSPYWIGGKPRNWKALRKTQYRN